MISQEQIREVIGQDLHSNDGDKIGKIGQVFLDDETGEPEWVTVSTGLFGSRESFVPLAQASLSGQAVSVPYSKDQIKGAPNVDVDGGHLSQEEEAQLYSYYGLQYSEQSSDSGLADTTQSGYAGTAGTAGMTTGTTTTGYTDRDRDGIADDVQGRTVGRDTSGPTTDDAMTRSEERVRVGTQQVQAGRVRLRKYIETEHVQVPVTTTRETVRVEREPITDANMGDAMSGPDLSEEEHEVVLTEERPIVAKETVPVERVRLAKDVETQQQVVDEEVRKEVIVTEGDDVTDTGRAGTTGTGYTDRDRRV